MQNVDIGRKRTASDIAKIQGFDAFNSQKSSICPWFVFDFSKCCIPKAMGEHERIALYRQHQKAFDFACQTSGSKASRSAPFRAIVARAWSFENHQRLSEFLSVVNTGLCSGEKDWAAATLRRTIEEKNDYQRSTYAPQVKIARLTGLAIRHFINGSSVKHIKELESDFYPFDKIPAEVVPF
ncbi:MAG: hypothetical protein ACRC62_15255 [Microcoleus sp.]